MSIYRIDETTEADGEMYERFAFKIIKEKNGRAVAWAKDQADAELKLARLDPTHGDQSQR